MFYEVSSWDSESIDWDYDHEGKTVGEHIRSKITYPKPESKSRPPWMSSFGLDGQLGRILDQAYIALDNDCFILASVGLRTALDRATELLEIDPIKSFVEKLEGLRTGGWIGDTEREILGVITEAGNAAAHRGWEPTPVQIRDMFAAMEVFVQRAFVVERNALKVKDSIPPKPTKTPPSST